MDDRGYIAQALFERIGAEGVAFQVLGDVRRYPEHAPPEAQLAVSRAAFAALPRLAARFCQELDLQLVELARADHGAWRFVLAWTDDVGRPRFLAVRVICDYYRGSRRLLRDDELLSGASDALFAHALLEGMERPQGNGDWLAELWHRNPQGAAERVARYWSAPADRHLVAQAASRGDWGALRAALPRLRRALHRAVLPAPRALAARTAHAARHAFTRRGGRIAFTGREGSLRSSVMIHVARDLAPLGLRLFEDRPGERRRADLRIVFDVPGAVPAGLEDVVPLAGARPLPAMVAEAERAILRWLECRVERRYPDAVVGENPLAARMLQYASRKNVPILKPLLGALLNSQIACPIRSPILMPYPFGIVIEAGVTLGSRVTVMQQASLHGAPVIEDNVCIGPGARIVGAVRIGRNAVVGANAVVTRDVPSHCTVVGANRILGVEKAAVAGQRLASEESVVNT